MFEKNINIDKKLYRENKIPLLHTDPSWVKLFGDVKDRDINRFKKDLMSKISEEEEIDRKLRKLKRQKLKSMKMILGLSDSINNDNKTENLGLLDEYKNRINKINIDIEELTFQMETIPKEIREINTNLLNATIEYGYKELRDKERILGQSIEELDILRERLKELINIRYDYEEAINETYSFFHGLLGSKAIEKIDKERLK